MDVYAAARHVHINPLQVDEMEPWQVAAALGVGATPTVENVAGPGAPVNQFGRPATRGDGTPLLIPDAGTPAAGLPGAATAQTQAEAQKAQRARNAARVRNVDQDAVRAAFRAAQARRDSLVRSPRGDQ